MTIRKQIFAPKKVIIRVILYDIFNGYFPFGYDSSSLKRRNCRRRCKSKNLIPSALFIKNISLNNVRL